MIKAKLFVLLGILSVACNVCAQKIYFSNIPRLNNKAYYNLVVGENAGGIYILRFKDIDLKGGFSIDRYSHNLDFVENNNYALGKHEKLLKIFSFDSGLFLVKRTFDKHKTIISVARTGFSTSDLKGGNTVYTTLRFDKTSDKIMVDFSEDRKTCAIWMEETDNNGHRIFVCTMVDINGTVLYTKSFKTGFSHKDIDMEQVTVSNSKASALVFVFTRGEKRVTETAYEEHFIVQAGMNFSIEPLTLGDNKYFISSYDMIFNEFKNEFYISGYFDFKKPKTVHGILEIKMHPGDSALNIDFKTLDRKFVAQLIGAKEEQDGEDPENFYLRKIIPRSDGGYLLIGEFFEITQQMETFYMNGVPQMNSKNMYNYNDIMLVSLDSTGDIEWRHVINKRQNSLYSLHIMQSIAVYICEKNVNILYNDNTNQNNRIMHITLSRDGVIEQKILLNSENEYTAFVPTEGKQTGYNRYVAPLIQSRQISLIQLIDTH